MPYFKATIDMLINANDESEACDAIAEAMRPLLKTFEPQSSIIDWRYNGTSNYPKPDTGEGFEYQ